MRIPEPLTPELARTLADELGQGQEISVSAPTPSAGAALAATLHSRGVAPLVIVTAGPRDMESMLVDLQAIAGDEAAGMIFPARESGRAAASQTDLAGDRLRVLEACRHTGTGPIVTCIQALMQTTLPPEAFARQVLDIRRGQTVDVDTLVSRLEAFQYRFGVEVTEKGEAGVRGGIVDIWSPASDWPVRIEFFGEEVESIRWFDPVEQTSRETGERVTIHPAGDQAGSGDAPSTALLPDHVPPAASWIWIEPETVREHGLLYEESLAETGAETGTVRLADFLARLEGCRRGGSLLLSDGGARDAGLRPVERLPGLGTEDGGVLDTIEKVRSEYIDTLLGRARAGESIHLFFENRGTHQRFREVYLRDPGAETLLHLHIGALSEGFACPGGGVAVIAESDLYGRKRRLRGIYSLHGRRRTARRKAGPRVADWMDMQPGDFVVHVDHGIGRYLGLYEIVVGEEKQEVLTVEYADKAKLHIPVSQAHLLSRYVGVGKQKPALHKLGGRRWTREKQAASKAVQDLAAQLLEVQAARQMQDGHAVAGDTHWQHEFEATFPYEETPDQEQAIGDVKRDLESARPMDRLICGDVGYGKTEVAMRAAFKVVMDGRQVCVLVPTTVLAQQHYNSFRERMAAFPVSIESLSRFRTRAEQGDVLDRLARGQVDIVIGTHRLVQKDVRFRNLGLVVIDEEQRFGVAHKEHLKTLRRQVDVLTLTATPIPRTLYMSLTGARDMSTIQSPPRDRHPIETIVTEDRDDVLRSAILRELNREGQVFFLHNRVQTIDMVYRRLRELVPEARIEVAHGQMSEKRLAPVMDAFSRGDVDVLLCTTIIESGVDIPNANTIIIDRADRFGVSDLYQLRGRVGRYRNRAYALLVIPRHARMLSDARKRIQAIQKYSALGSGFKVALQDLEIRGAGNILGAKQSGHISAVGFDLYCQLLRRTIATMKGEAPPRLIDVDVKLDFLDADPQPGPETLSAAIPTDYMEDESRRVQWYRRIAALARTEEVEELHRELVDRYGPLPAALYRLLQISRLKITAAEQNIRSIEVRGRKVLLMRGADYLKGEDRRNPRLSAAGPEERLEELIGIAQEVGGGSTPRSRGARGRRGRPRTPGRGVPP